MSFKMQLKHASRYVHDLLTALTKHMDMPSILYLLDLVSTLPPNAHTRQTLYLASLLIRIVWRAGLSSAVADAAPVAHTTSPIHGPLTSSKSLSNFYPLVSLENKCWTSECLYRKLKAVEVILYITKIERSSFTNK